MRSSEESATGLCPDAGHPIYTLLSYFFNRRFNIIVPVTTKSYKWSFLLKLPEEFRKKGISNHQGPCYTQPLFYLSNTVFDFPPATSPCVL